MVEQQTQSTEIEKDVNVSQSTLDVLFWMLEESHSATLEQQGAKLLCSHFGSLETARKYRSEKEAQQFLLNHIYSKNPPLQSIPA